MSGEFIYHYHAMSDHTTTIRYIDGITIQSNPILTYDDYIALKKLIAQRDGLAGIDGLIICNLSLLSGPREPKERK